MQSCINTIKAAHLLNKTTEIIFIFSIQSLFLYGALNEFGGINFQDLSIKQK